MIKGIVDGINETVLGSVDNETCNVYHGIDYNNKPCKHFFKTIHKSFPRYWKQSIYISPFKNQLETHMKYHKDKIWLVDKPLYSRDLSTDPESYAPDKMNPFDDKHPPRIYLSLGTFFNNNEFVFRTIMKIIGEKNYPLKIATSKNKKIFESLVNMMLHNSYTNIQI